MDAGSPGSAAGGMAVKECMLCRFIAVKTSTRSLLPLRLKKGLI